MENKMKNIQDIKFHTGSKEELLPNFTEEFPYIASRVALDKHIRRTVPWHWHKTMELFYIESGALEYCTPGGRITFPAGSGGIVNSNVLHTTRALAKTEPTIQLLHIFDASLLAGEQGSRIEKEYITPVAAASQLELVPFFPGNTAHEKIIARIVDTFHISSADFGYEMKLRNMLSEIWLMIFEETAPLLKKHAGCSKYNDRIKLMMIYVHEHYSEKISIAQLAAAAHLSERECFRTFHDYLHMTPIAYIKSYRLQMACQMLARGQEPVTAISHACGLGSSSYFGKVFREHTQCTPLEYRRKWQDRDI